MYSRCDAALSIRFLKHFASDPVQMDSTPQIARRLYIHYSQLLAVGVSVVRTSRTWAFAVVVSAMKADGARPSSRSPATSFVGSLSK